MVIFGFMTEVLGRLWIYLIFKHCDPHDLLQLRATCRVFRALLEDTDARPLWLYFTATLVWLRLDERALGWQGIERGLAREAVVRQNCAQGTFFKGPMINVRNGAVTTTWIVAERLVVNTHVPSSLYIYDIDTGEELWTYAAYSYNTGDVVIANRWILARCSAEHNHKSIIMIDCQTGASVEISAHHESNIHVECSISGYHFSCQWMHWDVIPVFRIGTDSAIVHVTSISINPRAETFHICNNGTTYIIYDMDRFGLFDMATKLCLRMVVYNSTVNAIRYNYLKPRYVVLTQRAIIRTSDGHCVPLVAEVAFTTYIPRKHIILAYRHAQDPPCYAVNPDTGCVVPYDAHRGERLCVDTSGETAWCDNQMGVCTSLGGRIVIGATCPMPILAFQYGIMVVDSTKTNIVSVMRFDKTPMK